VTSATLTPIIEFESARAENEDSAGEFIVKEITKIDHLRVAEYLQLCDVRVSLQGDFEGSYVIKDGADLKKLPTMLELTEGSEEQESESRSVSHADPVGDR